MHDALQSKDANNLVASLILSVKLNPQERSPWISLVAAQLEFISAEKNSSSSDSDSLSVDSNSNSDSPVKDTRMMIQLFSEGLLIRPNDPDLLYVLGILHHRIANSLLVVSESAWKERNKCHHKELTTENMLLTGDRGQSHSQSQEDSAEHQAAFQNRRRHEYLYCAVQYLERSRVYSMAAEGTVGYLYSTGESSQVKSVFSDLI